MKKLLETSFYNSHREWLKKYEETMIDHDKDFVMTIRSLAQCEDISNSILFFVSFGLPLLFLLIVIKGLAS
jgi:hypothetical protein